MVLENGREIPEVSRDYRLIEVGPYTGPPSLATLPSLVHDRPFDQGVTACADIAEAIAAGLTSRRRRSDFLDARKSEGRSELCHNRSSSGKTRAQRVSLFLLICWTLAPFGLTDAS